MNSSVARIFLSSTFRDFGEERELLAKRVFPALRKRLQERFVELVDVDLRWGITPEAAERGEVLPICLAEIDRSRPWFIGMLGERYGWVPPSDKYDPALVEQRPWLAEHKGGKSVTELEILHGVLNDPEMAGRAFFYFRAPAYARRKGGDYVSTSGEDAVRLADLKDRIRASGFPVLEDYPNPEALAKRLEADLWAVLDEAYPQADTPDAFTREQRRHEAYALPRRRLYLGGEVYQTTLDEAFATGEQRIIIGGQSGGGKSALIANWLGRRRQTYTVEQIHEYYLGASAEAASPVSLVRHLIERIKRTTGSQDEIPVDPQALFDSLATWLAEASAHAGKEDYRWIITLDGLNGLSDLRDLRWLSEFLPERVHMLVSCLPGEVRESLVAKGAWQTIAVLPLTQAEQRQLLQTYLGHYNKTLEAAYEARVLAHLLAANPLFLRTLAEELRLFGRHEDLSDELNRYLSSQTVDDLFERVLERVEHDCGAKRVKKALTAIWASRAGLAEEELLAFAGLVPATWAPIRLALDEALLESGGRLTFAHDYMRIAVSDRYLAGNNALGEENQSAQALALRRKAHEKLARWFTAHAFPGQVRSDGPAAAGFTIDAARAAEEIPYQWRAARNWQQLKACLTDRAILEAFLNYRSSDQLIELWLEIEPNTADTLESAYEVAWERWLPDNEVQETAEIAGKLSRFLREAGRYKHQLARRLAQLALTITVKTKGADHLDTASALNNLTRVLHDMGEYSEAERRGRQALNVIEKKYGSVNPSTGKSLNSLAMVLHAKGDYARAEPLYRRALAIAETAEFQDQAENVERLSHLALLLYDKGDHDGAAPLFRRALAIAENSLGPYHSDTGVCLNNLAMLLHAKAEYADAEWLYRRALAVGEKVEGPNHPGTGVSLNNLARLLHEMGNHNEAELAFCRALAITEKALGSEHPITGVITKNLARLLKDNGDYTGAVLLYFQAIDIMEKMQGDNQPKMGIVLHELAELLLMLDRFDEAEPMFRRQIAIVQQNEGDQSLSLAANCHQFGIHLMKAGRLEEAEIELQNALVIREMAKPPRADLAHTLSALGKIDSLRGDKKKALQFYDRSLEILRSEDEPRAEDIKQLLERIVELGYD